MIAERTRSQEGGHVAKWQEIVERNLPLVKYVLGRLSPKLPASVDREELLAAGSLALLGVAQRYDPSLKATFSHYAIPRIRGAMLDELRGHDCLGRYARAQVSRMEKCRKALVAERGREPTNKDVASEMGCSCGKVAQWAAMSRASQNPVDLDACAASIDGKRLTACAGARSPRGPSESAQFEERRAVLARCIRHLSEREKRVILLRYYEHLSLQEIGDLLSVTPSRVCQIHKQTLRRLRRALGDAGVDSV